MEIETAVAEISDEFNDQSSSNQSSRGSVSFIDPATILFEIAFGCRLEMGREAINNASGSSKGLNPVLHIWM